MMTEIKKAIWEDKFLSVVYTDEDGITSVRDIAVFVLGSFPNGNEAIRVHDGEGWKTFLVKRMNILGFGGSYDSRDSIYSRYSVGIERRFVSIVCWKMSFSTPTTIEEMIGNKKFM